MAGLTALLSWGVTVLDWQCLGQVSQVGTVPCAPCPEPTVLLVQGLYEECQYLFQPQLIVQRLVNIAVLYPGFITEQSMAPHNRSYLYK